MNARQVSYDMFQYLSRRSSDGCLRVPISSSIEADMIMGECSPIMLSTTVGIATSVDKVNTNDKIALPLPFPYRIMDNIYLLLH